GVRPASPHANDGRRSSTAPNFSVLRMGAAERSSRRRHGGLPNSGPSRPSTYQDGAAPSRRYGCTGIRLSLAACSDKHVDELSQALSAGGLFAPSGNAIGAPNRLDRSSEAGQCGRLHKGSSRYFSRHAIQPKNTSISPQQFRALLSELDD